MYTKLLSVILAALMLLSLAACGKKSPTSSPASSAVQDSSEFVDEPIKIDTHPASELEVVALWTPFRQGQETGFLSIEFFGWGTAEYTKVGGDSGILYWEVPENGTMNYSIKENGEWVKHTWTIGVDFDMLTITEGDVMTVYAGLLPPKYTDEMCGVYQGGNGVKLVLCPDGYGYFLNSYNVITYIKWNMANGTFSYNEYGEPRETALLISRSFAYTQNGETFTLTDSGVTYTRTEKLDLG